MDRKNLLLPFDEGVTNIGLTISDLRVEGFRTDGTTNYLANLNYCGQTWAAALRLPAMGGNVEEFLSDKKSALQVVDYLSSILKNGVDVGFDCVLKFDGMSYLVEGRSAQNFLRRQAHENPLRLIDSIGNREKKIEGFHYPDALDNNIKKYISNYIYPFYLSRGAPAWETLEEYPELEEPVAHALAILHLLTGKGMPIPYEIALNILSEIEPKIHQGADGWSPIAGSKEALALEKSITKWKGDQNPERAMLIRRERFMRAAIGRKLYHNALEYALARHTFPHSPLKSFFHGDAHGGNFILVRYQYILNRPGVLLDRVFLNEIFEKEPALSEIAISIDEKNTSIIHDMPYAIAHPSLVATKKFYHEIHPIDLDDSQGITKDTKVIHLYDALFYAISLENLTSLFSSRLNSTDILKHYYDGLTKKTNPMQSK